MRRRAFVLLPAAGLSAALSCKSVEPYVPELIAITGTLIEVAAMSYQGGQYAPQVNLLMSTLTPAATSMASQYIAQREEARKREELAKLDQEIQAEYASLEGTFVAGGAPREGQSGLSWGSAASSAPAPAATQTAAATPQGAAPTDSASPWGTLYAAKGVAPESAGPPALEVALLRSAAGGPATAFEDGAVLHDGGDGTTPADAVRVFFRPSEAMYVYVVAIDAAARVQPLYPTRFPPRDPVPGGAAVWLPDETESFGLDENRGVQHVYFYASRERQTDLEAQLYRFASRPQPTPGTARVSQPTRVEGEVVGRGLTGAGEGAFIDGTGKRISFPTTRQVQGPEGHPIVVTRYFDHR